MTCSALQFPLYGFPNEVRAPLPVFEGLVDAGQRPLGEPSWGLLVVDLRSSYRSFAFGARPLHAFPSLLVCFLGNHNSLLRAHLIPFATDPPVSQFPMGASLSEIGNITRHWQNDSNLKPIRAGDLHNKPPAVRIPRYANLLGAIWGTHYVQKCVRFAHGISDIIIAGRVSRKQENFRYHLLPSYGYVISSNHRNNGDGKCRT
jgi:hypothetical protein